MPGSSNTLIARLAPALFVFLAVVTSTPASAQHLSLHIRGGRVTLDARDVTLQQILEEWTRIGGVRVVNGQQMSATPLTLLLRVVQPLRPARSMH